MPTRSTIGDDSQWGPGTMNKDRFDAASENPNRLNPAEGGDVAWLHRSTEPHEQQKAPASIAWPSRSDDDSTKADEPMNLRDRYRRQLKHTAPGDTDRRTDDQYNNFGGNKRGDVSWRHGGSESGDGTTPTTFKNGEPIRGNNAYQSSYNQNSQSQESYKQQNAAKNDGQDNLLDEQSLRNGDQGRDSENRKDKNKQQESMRSNDGGVSNPIDEIPIKAKAPKTFEQLLEEEMAKGAGGGGIVAQPQQSPSKAKQTDSALPKRDFLRKNTNLR